MRIATYNIEWFAELFSKDNKLLLDDEWSRRHNVTRRQQANAIATVLRAVDADLTFIVEAPNTGHKQNTVDALEQFAAAFGLRQSRAAMGFANETQQELAVLFDPARVMVEHDPKGEGSDGRGSVTAPRFDSAFRLDIDVDAEPEIHRFSKPPLELAVTALPSGRKFRMIGVHAKSKAPHGARNRQDETRISIANRRKQLAQCIWIRQRVDAHLDAGDDLVVLGDFNDGPGLDGYEKLFGRSGIEIVIGTNMPPDRMLAEPHARLWLDPRQGWALSTARFYSKELHRYLNAMLDYVMLSPDFAADTGGRWQIWHPFDDPDCYADDRMREALLTASDHFPVSVDLTL
ncbi:endonuclease/exonuclease/phosphatase family protein [Oceanomicrobium pacificus]|uniref:Endonuclease n=1 Tax=Oceanomicrobium pacificus TaxID=2692916 RepID=A0A6B0TVR5_9RHOB|nr:endonuclease/exonuclease/phosphatase family protein [Oceanomicrobium pacificus]MXU65254.1 endonuclease [Oceanomicrobium pacificus]